MLLSPGLSAAVSKGMSGSVVPDTMGPGSDHHLPAGNHEQLMGWYCWWLIAHARQPLFQLLPLTFLFNALFASKMLVVKRGGRGSQAIIC